MSFGVPLSALGIFSSKSYKNDSLYLIHTLVMNLSQLTENENSSKSPLYRTFITFASWCSSQVFYGHFYSLVAGRGTRTDILGRRWRTADGSIYSIIGLSDDGPINICPMRTTDGARPPKDKIGRRINRFLSEADIPSERPSFRPWPLWLVSKLLG